MIVEINGRTPAPTKPTGVKLHCEDYNGDIVEIRPSIADDGYYVIEISEGHQQHRIIVSKSNLTLFAETILEIVE